MEQVNQAYDVSVAKSAITGPPRFFVQISRSRTVEQITKAESFRDSEAMCVTESPLQRPSTLSHTTLIFVGVKLLG